MKLIKQCRWCGSEMLTTRSSKVLCSQKCHNQFHYWRHKTMPGLGPAIAFKYIDDCLSEDNHPNEQHPTHRTDEVNAAQTKST